MSSVNDPLATAIFSRGGMFVSGHKRKKEVDINHFHISHTYVDVLEATSHSHRIRLMSKFGSVFRLFASGGDLRSYSAQHDCMGTSPDGTDRRLAPRAGRKSTASP